MCRFEHFLLFAIVAYGCAVEEDYLATFSKPVYFSRQALTRKPNTSLYFAASNEGFSSILSSFADKHPDINVTTLDYALANMVQPFPYSFGEVFREELPLLMQSYLGPDIAPTHVGRTAMGMKHDLMDLRAILYEAGLMDVLEPTTYTSCQGADGSIYCVGLGGTPWWFIMSRTVFQLSEVNIPETFEELVNACRILHEAGDIPIAVTGEDWLLTAWLDIMDMRTNGVDFHADLASGVVSWTDSRVRRTFENWQRLIDANCFQRDLLKHNMWDWDFSVSIGERKIAMMFNGDFHRSWPWNFHQDMSDIDVFSFPQITTGIKRGNMLPQDGFVVRRTTNQAKIVVSFLSEQFQKTVRTNDDLVRVQPRKDNQIYNGRFTQKLQKMLNETDIPWSAFDLEVPHEFFEAVKYPLLDWFNGSMTLDTMLNLFENFRILMVLQQNLRPHASLPGGVYESEVIVALQHSSGISQQERDSLDLMYSINDDEVTSEYNGTLKLGIGDWTLRAFVKGGRRKDSAMLKYTYTVVRPTIDAESTSLVLIISVILLGVALLSLSCVGFQRGVRSFIEGRKARFAQRVGKVSRIRKAIYNATNLSFPMCLVQFSKFEKDGKILQHEVALAKGHLEFLHTFDEVTQFRDSHLIIFISHQWLAFREPDPENIHFNAIIMAVKELARIQDIDLAEIWLWIDYISIPQRNLTIKLLSVASIAAYASAAALFVVVAPPTFHADTAKPCNIDTYEKRGWCRLEQWSSFALNGIGNMCIFDGELKPLAKKDESCQQFAHVFDGDFTVESDKYDIVDLVIGLWAHSIYHASESRSATEMFERREQIFPEKYFGELTALVEPIVLEDIQDNQSDLSRALTSKADTVISSGSGPEKVLIRSGTFKKIMSVANKSTNIRQSALVLSYGRSEKLLANRPHEGLLRNLYEATSHSLETDSLQTIVSV